MHCCGFTFKRPLINGMETIQFLPINSLHNYSIPFIANQNHQTKMPKKFCSIILTVFLYMAFVLIFACQIGFPILAIAQRSCCDCEQCGAGTYIANCELECNQKVKPLAIVRAGDPITINAEQQMLNLDVPQKEILARLASWKKPAPIVGESWQKNMNMRHK